MADIAKDNREAILYLSHLQTTPYSDYMNTSPLLLLLSPCLL